VTDAATLAHRQRARHVFDRFGHGALLPFQRSDDKHWFIGREGDSLISYGLAGRVAVVLGDPVGPDDHAWATFDRFLAACRAHRIVPVVYQATAAGRQRLDAAGFRCFPIGREAIVDLGQFDLRGPKRANLRHTVTRAERGGIRICWWPGGLAADEIARFGPGLTAIDTQWRRSAGPTMGFTIGTFETDRLATATIAIALDSAEAPVACATFAPTGADGGWVLDLLRRDPSGVPGALESCVARAAYEFRAERAQSLSLGLVPLWGLDRQSDLVEERLLARSTAVAAPVYDVDGLAFFKAKFDPRWETRYAAVPRRRDLAALVLGLLKLHLVPPGGSIRSIIGENLERVLA